MTDAIFESIWKLIKENKVQPINQISNELMCNICKKLMVKACNTPCGCRYCSDCIANYLDGLDKFCPGNNRFCQMKLINYDKDVVIDNPISIRISEIVVKCSNKHCEFTDELSLIGNHMRTCNKNPTSCPYFQIGCKTDQIINDEMKDHLYIEICCHTKLLLDFINNLRNEMESMKNEIVELKSENKHLSQEVQILKNKLENKQMKNEEFEKKIMDNLSEIEELNNEMVFIKNENRLLIDKLENIEKLRITEVKETMQEKLEWNTREVEEIKDKYQKTEQKEIEMKQLIDGIEVKCQESINKQNKIIEMIEEMNVKYQQAKNKEIEMERFIKELRNQISDLIIRPNNYEEEIKNNTRGNNLGEINENLNKIFGKFEWKVENFFQESRTESIYSEPFYSHKNGYKMCLSAWFDDCLYLQVGFHLMKGEFDNNLLWPCKHFVTIDIIIEIGGIFSKQETIKYDDSQGYDGLNKPIKKINNGFCFYELLNPNVLMSNEPLVIKCKLNT